MIVVFCELAANGNDGLGFEVTVVVELVVGEGVVNVYQPFKRLFSTLSRIAGKSL